MRPGPKGCPLLLTGRALPVPGLPQSYATLGHWRGPDEQYTPSPACDSNGPQERTRQPIQLLDSKGQGQETGSRHMQGSSKAGKRTTPRQASR